MKAKFLFLFVFAAIAIGFTSCKKDKDNDPAPAPGTQKIRQYKNGEDIIRFDYDGDGLVKTVVLKTDLNTGGNEMVYTVSYNAQKKIVALQNPNGQKIEPVYDNGVMIRADIFEADKRIGYTNYQYGNGKILRATIYFGQTPNFEPLFSFDFAYNNAGNLMETIAMIADGTPGRLVRSGHVDFQYDDKVNPLYEQRDVLALFWQGASKNNIVLENHFDENLVLSDKYVYNYVYKPNGLPDHATVKIGLPGQPLTDARIDYNYQ